MGKQDTASQPGRIVNLTTHHAQLVTPDEQVSEQLADAVYTYCLVVYDLCSSHAHEEPDKVSCNSTFSHHQKNAA
jgi:hypothetical protein